MTLTRVIACSLKIGETLPFLQLKPKLATIFFFRNVAFFCNFFAISAKIRYHIFHFKHIHPQNEKQKKRSFILMRTQIGFNLKCIAQCICSKSSGLTFLDNVWFGMFERSLRPVLRVADSP